MDLMSGNLSLVSNGPQPSTGDTNHIDEIVRLMKENRQLKDDLARQHEAFRLMDKNHHNTTKLLHQQLDEKDDLIKSLQELLRNSTSKSINNNEPESKLINNIEPESKLINNNVPETKLTPDIPLRSTRRRRNSKNDGIVKTGVLDESTKITKPKLESSASDSDSLISKDSWITPKVLTTDKKIDNPTSLDLKNVSLDTSFNGLGIDLDRSSTRQVSSFTTPVLKSSDHSEKLTPRQLDAILEKLSKKISSSSVLGNNSNMSSSSVLPTTTSTTSEGPSKLYSVLKNKSVTNTSDSILTNSSILLTSKSLTTANDAIPNSLKTVNNNTTAKNAVDSPSVNSSVMVDTTKATNTPNSSSVFGNTPNLPSANLSNSVLTNTSNSTSANTSNSVLEKTSNSNLVNTSNPALLQSSSSLLANSLHSIQNTNTSVSEPVQSNIDDSQVFLSSPDSKTNEPYDESMSKSLMNAHNNGTSNTSIRSYKTRIRLPPSIQEQHNQYDLQSDHDSKSQMDVPKANGIESIQKSSSLGDLETNDSIRSDKQSIMYDDDSISESYKDNENSMKPNDNLELPSLGLSKETLKSAFDLQDNKYNQYLQNDKILTPTGDNLSLERSSTAEVESYQSIPKTPDAFGQKFFKNLMDDKHSAYLSPIANTFQNSPLSQVKTPSNNSGFLSLHKPTSNSSFHVSISPKIENEPALFIQPDDFHTIYLHVLSTISVNSENQNQKNNDPNCTIAILDRATDKEMWKIRKSYSQIVAFDSEIRPIIEYFGIPSIPEKSIFLSTTPSKVDHRRTTLQNYFNSLALLPHIPQLVLMRICRYISLDFVNPLDDFKSGARKEGFLLRRSKGLGSSWKVRWCQADGPVLEIYENPGGQMLEQIKLKGCQIGRQNTDSVAEDKGYRHAFLIMEGRKNSKLSSSLPKHFFCAESDEDRDSWVNVLLEYNEPDYSSSTIDLDTTSQVPDNGHDVNNDNLAGLNGNKNSSTSSITLPLVDNIYSTYQTSFNHNQKGNSNNANSTFNSNNNHNINRDTMVTNLEEEPTKKTTKKKSFLSFINKSNADEDQQSAVLPAKVDTSMQQYLDQIKLDDNDTDAIFGRELLVSYNLSNKVFDGKSVPSIIYRCLDFFSKTGAIYEEGIFRLSGSASTIRQLKDCFNKSFDLDLFQSHLKPDMHTVSGLFKTYLRELPSPIIGRQAYQYLNGIVLNNNNNNQISTSATAILFRDYFNNTKFVDEIHYNTSYVIFKFLKIVIQHNQINRMNLRNVCIVFVPTLNISLEVLSIFLTDFDCIFEKRSPLPDSEREILDLKIPNF